MTPLVYGVAQNCPCEAGLKDIGIETNAIMTLDRAKHFQSGFIKFINNKIYYLQ